MIFNTACMVNEVLHEAWVGEVNEGFVVVFVVNMRSSAVFDTFAGVQVDATIDVVSDIGVEVLTARAVVVHGVLDIDPDDPVKMSC